MPISNLNNVQADVLWEDTAANPNLPASNVSSLNKALQTTNKRVIKAINEVNTNTKSAITANQNLINDLNRALGNFSNGVDGVDVISAIKALQTKVSTLEAGGGAGGGDQEGIFLLDF